MRLNLNIVWIRAVISLFSGNRMKSTKAIFFNYQCDSFLNQLQLSKVIFLKKIFLIIVNNNLTKYCKFTFA